MNKRLHCQGEYKPKRATSKYCSAKCRKLAFQSKGLTVPENAKGVWVSNGNPVTIAGQPCVIAVTTERIVSLEDYLANPADYIKRANPEKLNWGVPLSEHELSLSEFTCNRVTIPGDWDYEVANV